MISKLFAPLIAKVLAGALVAALLATAVQTYRAGYWKRVAVSLRLDLDRIKFAQEVATAQWQAKLSENANRQRAAIQGARNEERRKAMLDASAAYARNNRVRTKAAEGSTRRAGDAQADPAPRNDRSGADAEMVAVARDEFDILVNNTIRLDTVQRQAEALIASGAAVREVDAAK